MNATLAVTKNQQESNSLEFETYLSQWAYYIAGEMSYDIDLVQASVTMHVRSRGITISDMCSNYGTRPETQGQWLNYDPNLDGDVHPLNIVGPAITTNKNACLQSNAAVEVTSANQSAEHKNIANRWQRVADYFERTTWSEAKRGFIFDAVQKEGTNLVEVLCKESDRQSVPEIDEAKTGLALFQCQCGKSGIMQVEGVEMDGEESIETQISCPECGEMAEAVVKPLAGLQMNESEVPVYDVVDQVIPFFNYTIDTYGAKVDGIKGAGWLQIQRLRDTAWMNTNFPGRNFTGPSRWSYTTQASYALARGRWQYLNQQPRDSRYGVGHEKYEVKEIYLHESAYSNYRAPQDYEFVDCYGKKTFAIKKGQTIGEAQKACYGEDQHGFKFIWSEQMLLTICSPESEELNFHDRFSDIHWSRESGSYNSSPNYSIVYIQDDITLLNTLNHNIIARNAVNPIFYDSLVFEKNDFSNEFVGTKNAALLPDFDMRKAVTSLPIPTPSPYLSQQMQWLWTIKDSVSMVTPAMRGESQGGAPYAAQRQQLEQSYGNLTAVLKSFAQCKVTTFKNQGKVAKKRWTKEQFQRVASGFAEIWTDEDIEEMCAIDFERDLIVNYREGSEMPSTPMSKELKFFGALQQLGGVIGGLPPDVALQIIGQEKWASMVEKIGEFGDFDFDVSGLQTDEVISQKRFISLAKLCEPFQSVSYGEIEMWRQEVVAYKDPDPQAVAAAQQAVQAGDAEAAQQAIQPTPITRLDMITEKIFHDSEIRFSKYEDLEQSQTFFIEQLRIETGKTKPNQMLLAMLEVLLGLLEQAIGGQKEEAMAADPQVQAAQAADAAAQEAQDKADALAAAKLEDDAKLANAKLLLEEKKIDNEDRRADRDAFLMVAEDDEVAEDPIEAISIPYDKLPSSAQQQVLEHSGINVSTAELDKKAEDDKPTVANKPTSKKK